MMYPFMTLNDDTEITHTEMKADGKVKVYIETPDEFGGFHNATCWLPDYKWEDIEGYSDTQIPLIIYDFSQGDSSWTGRYSVRSQLPVPMQMPMRFPGLRGLLPLRLRSSCLCRSCSNPYQFSHIQMPGTSE